MPFTEERLPPGHSAIKPRSVECCSDGCPYGSFSHLGFLVTALAKVFLPRLLSLAGQPGLERVLIVLPLNNYGGHCAFGNLECSRNVFVAFPRSVPTQPCLGVLQAVPSFFALICIVSFETLYREVCAFPKHILSIEFTTAGLQGVETYKTKMIKRNGRHLNSFQVS